ncbi:hypothetical protein [Eggerthella sp. YY7918]|uniref:AbrB/MazE/SpoVT family DNA-binding domain-containing protein n=1 Tax=Eggerthella sp. (strain YY7918) TaxID=502558 RepID=UPI0002170F42|nr:hypothetical protein [Eggerthella sp. YY7918]BAK43886.1 selenocysteine lyase [Eggerthella sp. YY7918]
MTTTKLSQWGTGQGFHVTKAGMEITGTAIGDLYEVEYLPGAIIFRLQDQPHRKVKRKTISFEEVQKAWNGSRSTNDPWNDDADGLHGAEREVWGC